MLQIVDKLATKARGGPARRVIRTAAETDKEITLKRRAVFIFIEDQIIVLLWILFSKPYANHISIKLQK